MNEKEKKNLPIRSSAAEYLTFVAATGECGDGMEMRYEDENIWLTQKMMAILYDVDVRTINYHVRKVFTDSELEENSVIRNFRITASDGKNYCAKHYGLQMIIAVGFKVNSERAVQFRKWVNQIASEYTIKGWVMDDERLKKGTLISRNSWNVSVRFGQVNGNFIKKLRISTQRPLITIKQPLLPDDFTRQFRINCTLPFMVIPLLN